MARVEEKGGNARSYDQLRFNNVIGDGNWLGMCHEKVGIGGKKSRNICMWEEVFHDFLSFY
jgi:hypothetical protein